MPVEKERDWRVEKMKKEMGGAQVDKIMHSLASLGHSQSRESSREWCSRDDKSDESSRASSVSRDHKRSHSRSRDSSRPRGLRGSSHHRTEDPLMPWRASAPDLRSSDIGYCPVYYISFYFTCVVTPGLYLVKETTTCKGEGNDDLEINVTLYKAKWRHFELFQKLDEADMHKCINHTKVKTFHEGTRIIERGSIGTIVFFIDVGTACAQIRGQALTTVLGSSNHFGKIAFMATCKKIIRESSRRCPNSRSASPTSWLPVSAGCSSFQSRTL